MGIKDCRTCKFLNVFPLNEPCRTCRETFMREGMIDHPNWKQKEPEEPEKKCMTCKFANVFPLNEPCKTCNDTFLHEGKLHTKWEPKEQGQEEKSINEEMTLELKMEAELSEEQKAEICGFKYPRKRILTLAVPKYEHESSRYPEHIRVSFADGHTAVYDLRVDQPAPQIVESIKIIRRMKQGYVNQPMRRRRNRR